MNKPVWPCKLSVQRFWLWERERSNQISIIFVRELQSTTNYFLLSLALADLLVCTIVMPFGAATFIMGMLLCYHITYILYPISNWEGPPTTNPTDKLLQSKSCSRCLPSSPPSVENSRLFILFNIVIFYVFPFPTDTQVNTFDL